MAANQAPPSLGFSRQEHWSGLPFPSPMHESEKWKSSRSVMSDSLRPHGLHPTRLLHPWDFPGKSTGVGCHCLLQPSFYCLINRKDSSKETSKTIHITFLFLEKLRRFITFYYMKYLHLDNKHFPAGVKLWQETWQRPGLQQPIWI